MQHLPSVTRGRVACGNCGIGYQDLDDFLSTLAATGDAPWLQLGGSALASLYPRLTNNIFPGLAAVKSAVQGTGVEPSASELSSQASCMHL